jgi:hypothetical protein
VLVDQAARDLLGEAPHLVEGARAVRVASRVAEVHQVLVGQQVDDGPRHGEASEPGVEHADGPVVAHRRPQ